MWGRRRTKHCQPRLPDCLEASEGFESGPVVICLSVNKALGWNLKARIRHSRSSIYCVLGSDKEENKCVTCSSPSWGFEIYILYGHGICVNENAV